MTQAQALTILKTGASVFLTGEPGSGKTFVVNAYIDYLRKNNIEPSITASTGIAATHIGGITIHSWSGIGIKQSLSKHDLDKISSTEYIVKRIRKTKVLIIDEISMLPSETLSMVDAVCREIKNNNEPFGGIQTVFVGDFFQLPPIVKRFRSEGSQGFFEEEQGSVFACNAPVWRGMNQIICYLTEQYRQDDENFHFVLSSIRSGSFNVDYMKHLEARKTKYNLAPENIPKLFSHNVDVDRVNDEMLGKIPAKLQVFNMSSKGHDLIVAAIKKGCLSPETLNLKIGASVMFTKNSPKDGWVNGTLGIVEGFDSKNGNPIIQIRNGKRITVGQMDWTVEENGKVKAQVFQFPLRLAWAITVHKSQGMSLDEAVMDLSDVFEYGQGYVALSRVRRLSGIYLLGWNDRVFEVHPEIVTKDKLFRLASEEAEKAFDKIPTAELNKMHNDFIVASGGVPGKKLKSKKEKLDTFSETLLLWRAGKNISEIIKERKITEATVFSHLEKLVDEGKISRTEIDKVISPALTISLPKIFTAFKELDTEKLSPVFEKLNGEYSYSDLKLARMAMKAK